MTAKKPVAKAAKRAGAPAAKAKKPGTAGKPAPKPAAKGGGKPAPKAVAKPAAKAAAKPAPKAPAKPAAKVPAKAPAKAAVKAPVKSPTKATAAAVVKPPAKVPPAAAVRPAATPVPASKSVKSTSTVKAPVPSSSVARKAAPPSAPAVVPVSAVAARLASLPPPAVRAMPQPIAVKKDPKLANNWKAKSAEELTDAEVLAMPDSEYMNEKQTAFFRHKLVQLKDAMLHNADETTEHLREDTIVVPDPADRATIEEEHALELRTRDRERKLLKKIEQSIMRLDAGDYGYCDETGEPIGVGRLLARPTATLSLEAQQRRELKQKMFGD